MSSGFVAAGSGDDGSAHNHSSNPTTASTQQDSAWAEAQRKIDATRQHSSLMGSKPKLGEQEGGKSLYETLQANKAAKQEAFDEATRFRNQFRSLDEDEVEFLDSVLESTRTQEAEVKKETREQLDAFRKLQEDAEKKAVAGQEGEDAGDAATADVDTSWALGPRKRKKGKERGGVLGGIKLRKAESADTAGGGGGGEGEKSTSSSPPKDDKDRKDTEASSRTPAESKGPELTEPPLSASNRPHTGKEVEHESQQVEAKSAAQAPSLGLVAYFSDEED
ncbi:hypothetical protein KC332_g7108 [Hortaea werneckii]|uniref:FAM192A/Fyv6 N-terminal domain-containing protein n=2 Tax=Hortaea werneckii TaxID=91943 RepID=A0A3M7I2V3_HORWE|nr:hypothetical protein KC358_g15118 [Hortaea werneckii]OTA25871.1 hypothetical protein BTJ68_12264 [Hortaea werneckii EXF-2000]KAI6844856.1 hypothetical protein KC350_g4707 [Hortaea werneckii]KAI6935943.1 hypothetical protein KC341_g6569 [Hortaea werneckii]KAI6938620.1 hypothetical protein KC348_g5440 [Hortaea werneckii]